MTSVKISDFIRPLSEKCVLATFSTHFGLLNRVLGYRSSATLTTCSLSLILKILKVNNELDWFGIPHFCEHQQGSDKC